MYEMPVYWDPVKGQVSFSTEKKKWLPYYIGMSIVFLLWLSCVYTLSTQPFFHRKGFGLLQLSILTIGIYCFSTTLSICYGIWTVAHNEMYSSALNYFLSLELTMYKSEKFEDIKNEIYLTNIVNFHDFDIFFY